MFQRFKEIFYYRSMLWGMIVSELRTRYKGSVIGFLWTFINPLMMLIVYIAVFSTVMRVNLPHYPAFLFIGLLAWNMFSTAVQASTSVIIRQASLVKKIYFPREILPLSVVGGSVINYLLSLIILIPLLLLSNCEPNSMWFFLPLIILLETIMTAGFSLLLSALNVFLRDLEHIMGVVLMAWFYLSPVVYSLSMIPDKYVFLVKLNPISSFIISYQDILYAHHPLRWKLVLYGTIFSISIFVAGWKVFGVLNKRFAEEV